MDSSHNLIWFVFGTNPYGYVDIADRDGDVMTNVPLELANKICLNRNRWVNGLEEMLLDMPAGTCVFTKK